MFDIVNPPRGKKVTINERTLLPIKIGMDQDPEEKINMITNSINMVIPHPANISDTST